MIQLPQSILDFIRDTQPSWDSHWFAGGSCMRAYQGLQIVSTFTDFDVFFIDQSAYEKVRTYAMIDKDYDIITESKDALTLRLPDSEQGLQLILRFESLDQCLANFDIRACAVATLDYENFILSESTQLDIKCKKMYFQNPDSLSMNRVIKYWIYGFDPRQNSIDIFNPEISEKISKNVKNFAHEYEI